MVIVYDVGLLREPSISTCEPDVTPYKITSVANNACSLTLHTVMHLLFTSHTTSQYHLQQLLSHFLTPELWIRACHVGTWSKSSGIA